MPNVLAGRNFDLGERSDLAREQIPQGAAYRIKDFIPQLDAPLRKRGGWSISTVDLNTAATCTRAAAVVWVPYSGDPHALWISDNGKLYSDRSFNALDGTPTGLTGFTSPSHPPFWHRDRIIILDAINTASPSGIPQKYYKSGIFTVGNVAGSPPQASVGASWGDYVLLANGWVSGTRYENRIWVSSVGNADSWSTGTAFFDMPEEVVRIVPMKTFILVFGYRATWMLVGDTPPPGGNWTRRDVFTGTGCMDARTVAQYRDYVIWANNTGVYKSDGVTLTDLTKVGGISNRWRDLVTSFNFTNGWSAAGGVFKSNYIISIFNASGTFVACLVCDIDREVWTEFTNFPAAMFAARQSGPGTASVDGHEELFFAHRTLPLGCYVSSVWNPSATNTADGDGTTILPQLETPFYKLGGAALKQIRRIGFTYDLRSSAGAYLQVEALTSPESGAAYTTLSQNLPTTTVQKRRTVDVRRRALGVGFRITQVNPSSDTRLAEIEVEENVLDNSR